MDQKIYLAYAGDEVEIGVVVGGRQAQVGADMAARTIEEITNNLIGDFDDQAGITISIR